MRAVVQRTGWSEVTVAGGCAGRAGKGLTVLLGVGREDYGRGRPVHGR